MIGQLASEPVAAPSRLPLPAAPREAAGHVPELPARQCTRCGAVGTHYLTCPGLRLPPGYRVSADPGPE